jgi:hypothetical protein
MMAMVMSNMLPFAMGMIAGGAIVYMYRAWIDRKVKPHIMDAADKLKDQM